MYSGQGLAGDDLVYLVISICHHDGLNESTVDSLSLTVLLLYPSQDGINTLTCQTGFQLRRSSACGK
jgi:hypothetical protein